MVKKPKRRKKIDYNIFIATMLLVIVGNIMVFSSSWPYAVRKGINPYFFINKNLIFSFVGIIIMFITSNIDYRIFKKYGYVLYILSIILSVLVLIFGDIETYNARRWLDIGPITIMPSDFLKLGTILAVCKYIDRNKKKLNNVVYGFLPMFFFLMISCGLVFLQPDLSTTMVMGAVIICIFIVGGVNLFQSALGLGILVTSGVVGIVFSKSSNSIYSII